MTCVVGFGDLMLRLSPPNYQRFIQATSFDANYTGAEANVLVPLSLNGVPTQFVTRIPSSPIADAAITALQRYAVGVRHIVRGEGRLGLFYLEKGASQRPSSCIYDRQYSAFTRSCPEEYDWAQIFSGATHFHLTGITPALGGDLPQICLAACQEAKRQGLTVSLDLNFRGSLWTPEQAQATIIPLMSNVDILIGGREDAVKMLNVRVDAATEEIACTKTAEILSQRYPLSHIAFTMRQSTTASENLWKAMLYHDAQSYFSKQYSIHLVDRVGGGDAFSAGLLYAVIHDFSPQHIIEYAAAAGCLKQTIEQDFNLSRTEEIERLVHSDGTARIQR